MGNTFDIESNKRIELSTRASLSVYKFITIYEFKEKLKLKSFNEIKKFLEKSPICTNLDKDTYFNNWYILDYYVPHYPRYEQLLVYVNLPKEKLDKVKIGLSVDDYKYLFS